MKKELVFCLLVVFLVGVVSAIPGLPDPCPFPWQYQSGGQALEDQGCELQDFNTFGRDQYKCLSGFCYFTCCDNNIVMDPDGWFPYGPGGDNCCFSPPSPSFGGTYPGCCESPPNCGGWQFGVCQADLSDPDNCDTDGDGYERWQDEYDCYGGDCNDYDYYINPGVEEICDDGIDNDCDEDNDCADDFCYTFPACICHDYDFDDYDTCDPDNPNGDGSLADCDDDDEDINPGVEEICDDGVDNDCDGLIDCGECGDCNGNGMVEAGDASYLSNYLFYGGDAPNPLWVADVNDDGFVDGEDLSYLVAYFQGGPEPVCSEEVCGNNLVEPPEECDGTNLSEQTCESLEFDGGDLSCNSTCGFNTDLCTGEVTPQCDLFSATRWSETNVTEGTIVELIIVGSAGCNGKTISFEITENVPFGFDIVYEGEIPSPYIFGTTFPKPSWTADWVEEHSDRNPQKYFFTATVNEQDGDSITSNRNNDLEVWQPPFNCSDLELSCRSYSPYGPEHCQADICNFIDDSLGFNCSRDEECSVGDSWHNDCNCTWRDGSCGYSYDEHPCSGEDVPDVGTCYFSEDAPFDDCTDGFLNHSWTTTWEWGEDNNWSEDPELGEDYTNLTDLEGWWHYDPIIDDEGTRHSETCVPGSEIIRCPAQIQLPFFGIYNLVFVVVGISLVYCFLLKRRR